MLHSYRTSIVYFFLFSEFSLIARQVQNIFTVIAERREQVPFSVAIENGELMQEFRQ